NARRSSTAGDGGHDAELVAGLDLRVQPVEEPDVLVAEIQVHEAAHALLVEQAILDAGVVLLERLDHGSDGFAGRRDLLFSSGEATERSGDTNGDHVTSSYAAQLGAV